MRFTMFVEPAILRIVAVNSIGELQSVVDKFEKETGSFALINDSVINGVIDLDDGCWITIEEYIDFVNNSDEHPFHGDNPDSNIVE